MRDIESESVAENCKNFMEEKNIIEDGTSNAWWGDCRRFRIVRYGSIIINITL